MVSLLTLHGKHQDPSRQQLTSTNRSALQDATSSAHAAQRHVLDAVLRSPETVRRGQTFGRRNLAAPQPGRYIEQGGKVVWKGQNQVF